MSRSLSILLVTLAGALAGRAAAQTVGFGASLDGSQQVPAIVTTATGAGAFSLNADGTLSYFVTTCDLTGIVAHIHKGAPGAGGSVVFTLAGGPTTWSGTTPVLTGAQEDDLLARLYYVDVHTASHPGGQVRGQIGVRPRVFGAQLDGLQPVPPNPGTATGGATLIVNPGGSVTCSVTTTGLTFGTSAHIHSGPEGFAGPIELVLGGGPVSWSGTWIVEPEQIADLQAGDWYVDVDTLEHPAGAIRGQLLPANPCAIFAEPFDHAASWTFSASNPMGVAWGVDATPALILSSPSFESPATALNFNNGTNFDGGPGVTVTGTATSAVGLIDLTGQPEIELSFACNYATQTAGTASDRRFVEFSNNGFASANLGSLQLAGVGPSAGLNACAAMGTWHKHVVATTLTAAGGANVQMRFRFDSAGGAGNGGAGWFVDDIKIRSAASCPEEDCNCDDDVAVVDANGNPVLPAEATEITDELVDMDMGLVEDLYPDDDTSLDLWYEQDPCAKSIGEEPPPTDATTPNLAADLAAVGITGVTAEEIIAALADWENEIAELVAPEPDVLSSPFVPPASADYTPPAEPHGTVPGECYVLGGRDLVFVHGLQLKHVFDKILLDEGANTPWKQPTSFPGSAENFHFYDKDGYYKKIAVEIWEDHIQRFLRQKGIKNRYLIVPYSCAERLEVAAQSVLTQIGDAMNGKVGVVDPMHPLYPTEPLDPPVGPFDFGTPSFVILSHSTGGPVVDVALSVAASNPSLHASFIPQYCKAHIALHGALNGSRLATAGIALTGVIGGVTQVSVPWLCPLVSATITLMTGQVHPCPMAFSAAAQSILVDLVPSVMQLKWADEIDSTPVRTVTVIGGHPSFLYPLKTILLPGFDDGVANINSQSGNPAGNPFWPNGFLPEGFTPYSWPGLYDRGVAQTAPNRAQDEFIEQVVDPKLQPATIFTLGQLVAGGATPWVTPTGMLQPVRNDLSNFMGGVFSTLRRYENHFSFLQSASDHFGPNGSFGGFNGVYYKDTLPFTAQEKNWEETRVLTDERIYDEYRMVYPLDNEPLLTEGLEPKLHEVVRGRVIQFKLFGKKYKWWIWKRRYHLLAGSQTLQEMDYVYRYLLSSPGVIEPCDPDWTNMGCSLPGIFGPPLLEGTGALAAGNTVSLDLSNAAPSAPCMLFASISSTPVPFKGGTLCAFPFLTNVVLFTNGAGNLHLPFAWPSGIPAGISIYAQMIVADFAAVQGVAISNLVKGVTQ